MPGGSVKNPGNMRACAALFFFITTGSAAAAQIEMEIHPQRVAVGDSATLEVRLSETGSAEPAGLPAVDGLDIAFSGTQKSFKFINGKSWSGIVLTFRVTPARRGVFTIPSFAIKTGSAVLKTKPVRLAAVNAPAQSRRGAADLKTMLSVSKKRVFAGEPVVVRYFLLHAGIDLAAKPAFEKYPASQGFLMKEIGEDIPDTTVRVEGDTYVKTHVATFAAIPLEPGMLRLGGASCAVSFSDENSFFPFASSRRLAYESDTVTVAPLPAAGRPPSFSGDVGSFAILAEYGAEPVTVSGEKKIVVRVKGSGNFISLTKPRLAASRGALFSTEANESIRVAGDALAGEKEYVFTFIPDTAGDTALGGASISFFNPSTLRYEEVRTPNIRFVVKDAPPRQAERTEENAAVQGPESRAPLYRVAVFAAVAAAAIAVAIARLMRRRAAPPQGVGVTAPAAEAPVIAARRENPERDMISAARMRDAGRFLPSALKALAGIEHDALGAKSEGLLRNEIAVVRDELYRYGYGGKEMTPEDMAALCEKISALRKARE